MPKRIFLAHYGTKYHSGRYPYGSGEDPFQHDGGINGRTNELKRQGFSEREIAQMYGMSSFKEVKEYITISKNRARNQNEARAIELKEKGWSNVAIAKELGISEAGVRKLYDPILSAKHKVVDNTADLLKKELENKRFLDIGKGVSNRMELKQADFDAATRLLWDEGYEIINVQVPQAGTGFMTTMQVLAPPGTTYLDVKKNLKDVQMPGGVEYTEDGGRNFKKVEPPVSIDSSRIKVRYAEEGGTDRDGVIQVRPGVEDLALGNASYVQARIAVDGTHYLKGMVMYSDDIPEGYDIVFNTNKHIGTPLTSDDPKGKQVLKSLKDSEENPFGAVIKMDDELILAQRHYTDKDGNEKLSAINVVSEEGNWGEWSKTLSSQFLSKQPVELIHRQLGLAEQEKQEEFDEIMQVAHPKIRERLLLGFADECDSSAVSLKGASLPRQQSHVILPFPELKEDEIYAPNYNDGDKVVLVRHPHGGIFELPELTVNNHGRTAKEAAEVIGNAKDAVGINPKVAAQLSGADFDGDTVIVLPNNSGAIQTKKPLKQLEGYEPKDKYSVPDEKRDPKSSDYVPRMTHQQTQQEMGKISNLITDMTILGAPDDEIAKAVKHSMTVIDAEKHYLDYKQSYEDNDIDYLKEKYRGSKNAGASTIVSRAKSDAYVDQRKPGAIDKETGEKTYRETGETRVKFYKVKGGGYSKEEYVDENGVTKTHYVKDPNGNYEPRPVKLKTKTTKMDVNDPWDLVSGSPETTTAVEREYASYATSMKEMGNAARKEALNISKEKANPSAKVTYASAIESVKAKLNTAYKNKPLEKQAQILANEMAKAIEYENPGMDKDSLKKEKNKAITIARKRVGAKKEPVVLSDYEWEALSAGAFSNQMIKEIMDNGGLDDIKRRAMPKTETALSSSKISLIKSYSSSGFSNAEIADRLGISVSTVNKYNV